MAEAGATRPRCKCHDEVMYRDDVEKRRCPVKKRARVNARRARLVSRGLCVDCGAPTLSTWRCWDCLNKQEERRGLAI